MTELPFVSALVLAAGASRRMGAPKLAMEVDGVPMLRRVVETALASWCRETIVVLGGHEDVYRPLLDGLGVQTTVNPEYEHGMATSIRAGMEALSPESRAVVVLLADQPWINATVINSLITAYVTEGKRIVASAYHGAVGVPALFDGALYLELLTLEGDAGARSVIETYPREGIAIPLDEMSSRDVDTLSDLPGD